jgi:hypothetical protein
MRSAFAAALCIGLACGAAQAQDATYPFEDNAPAAASKKRAKPAVKPAAAPAAKPAAQAAAPTATPIPGAKPLEAIKQAVVPPETKPEPKFESKADAKTPPANDLAGVSANERDAIGWSIVQDPATGVRLGLPVKWVPRSSHVENGTHWSSRHGDVQIHTFRIKTADSLNALFEKEKREPANRKIESSGVKGDGFTVTGLQGLKKFGVRAQLKNGELRGYTVMFDQAMEGIVAPVTAAMASSFAPFPDSNAPIASLARPVDYGTGLIVSSDGHVITDRRVAENCNVIAVDGLGNAERIAVDRTNALALLRVYGKRDLAAAAMAEKASGDFTLVGIPDPHIQNGGKKRAEVKAQLGDGNAIRLRESVPLGGFSGAAALDDKGRVLGMMETRNAQLASAEGGLPPVRLVPAAAISDFLARHNVAAVTGTDDARAAVVRVICVRPRN